MRRRIFHSASDGTGGEGASPADADAALVAVALHNHDAFSALFERYWDPIFKYCYSRLGNWYIAEDSASEVFVKALASLDTFNAAIPGTTFRSWLFGIARHVIGTSYRQASNRPQAPLEDARYRFDPADSLEEQVLDAERHEELRRLLRCLPPDQQELLELRLAGLSAVEIGRVTGRSQEAVRKAQSRSVMSLRNGLKEMQMMSERNHG